jgi:ribosomal protein L9
MRRKEIMKTVFKSTEITHVWVSGEVERGRTSYDRMSFDGDTFYSYSTPIAHRRIINDETVYIINSYTFSSTSAKHRTKVVVSLPTHNNIVHVEYPHKRGSAGIDQLSNDEIADTLREEIAELWEKAQTAHTKGLTYLTSIERNIEYLKTIGEYNPADDILALNKDIRNEIIQTSYKEGAKQSKRQEEKREREKEREREKKRERRVKIAQEYNVPFEQVDENKTYLKITGNDIITSRGAIVPLNQALKLYRLRAHRSLVGKNIGYYEIKDVNDKSIQINCHKIEWAEIDRVLQPI